MKEQIVLLVIISLLIAFLFVFQNFFNTMWAIVFLLAFMFLYCFYMWIVTQYRKRQEEKMPAIQNSSYKPFVSILIPCHNEESVIKDTALNVLQLNYKDYEIILIDDRSKDETPKIIQELSAQHEKINYLIRQENAKAGKSAVLNDAMKIAKGSAILVLDADAKIEPDMLDKMLIKLEDKDVGAVQAQKVIINAEQNFLTRCQFREYVLDSYMQTGRDAVRGAVELRGNGELIKLEALKSINFWNEETITDDLDMSTRLHIKGWDIRFCPEVKVYEEGVIDFVALIRQRRRWVEGSIRRYLEHVQDVFTSKDMSWRVGFDCLYN